MSEFNYPSVLEEIGATPDQVSVAIKKEIKQFDESWNAYQDTQEEYDNCTDPQEKQVLMEELNSFLEDLQQADAHICHKLRIWHKNKDSYELKMQKMAEGRERKKAQQAQKSQQEDVAVAEPQAVVEDQVLSGTVVASNGTITTANSNPEPTYINANSFEEPQFNTPPAAAKEDGGSLGWWILGGAIAILTLGVGAKFLKK